MTKCQYYKLYQMLALDSVLFVEEKTRVVDLFGRVIVCWARSWVDIPEADALFELFADWTIVCFSVVVLLHLSVCEEEN